MSTQISLDKHLDLCGPVPLFLPFPSLPFPSFPSLPRSFWHCHVNYAMAELR